MKKSGLLNQPLMSVIVGMGHMDTLGIADAGLPIPAMTTRSDLAVLAAAYAQFQQRFARGEPVVKGAPEAVWINPPVEPNLP